MKVYRTLKDLKGVFKRPVITLGNFDGVHVGHQQIFELVTEEARTAACESIVFTFEPHPAKVLRPDLEHKTISYVKDKINLIEEHNIDNIILADFTIEFASQHPSKFVTDILYDTLNAGIIIVGHDFTFGKAKEGTINSLTEFSKKLGFTIKVVEAKKIGGEIVSSTRIRKLISNGDMKGASNLLGRYYSITGKVIKGHSRGKSLGFPTANLEFHGKLFPKDGVYAVLVKQKERKLSGVANVGIKPTFNDTNRTVEVNIFDFNESLYGVDLKLFFVERIRGETTFRNSEDLAEQISRDVVKAKEILIDSYNNFIF